MRRNTKHSKKISKGYRIQAQMMEDIFGRSWNDHDYVQLARNQQQMEDSSVPFCYDPQENLYHIKNCKEIVDFKSDRLIAKSQIPDKSNICRICYRRVIIRQGMNDDKGKFWMYYNFFSEHKVSSINIRRLSIGKQALFKILAPKSLLVTLPSGDEFTIEYSQKDKAFLIYHNNYILQNNERVFIQGQHLEDGGYDSMDEALNKIYQYRHWAVL